MSGDIFCRVNDNDRGNKKSKRNINLTKAYRHSNRSGNPNYTGGSKSVDREAFFKNDAGTQKANSAHNIRGDCGGITVAGEFVRNNRKKG